MGPSSPCAQFDGPISRVILKSLALLVEMQHKECDRHAHERGIQEERGHVEPLREIVRRLWCLVGLLVATVLCHSGY